ncbi:GH25 family lysozyme [Azotosporobacter soli]|uniref:GH25 family lysozyme n=1 Tax=Azotosporobacter soli TaxID=3055040 RepID=UPI0031FECA17
MIDLFKVVIWSIIFAVVFFVANSLLIKTYGIEMNKYQLYENMESDSAIKKKIEIRGIDVSAYQNRIEWEKVRADNIHFAYIKATEGKTLKDDNFIKNWKGARAAGISVGAYHYFTFGSDGIDQAENFIKTVSNEVGNLPPAVDIEFEGNSTQIPAKEKLKKELKSYIQELEKFYKQKPILYVTYESYEKYIMGDFEEYPVWIRDTSKNPELKDGKKWALWQFSNSGKVLGINTLVDLNKFNGDEMKFEEKW